MEQAQIELGRPYAYILAYPDGRIFYAGKGRDDRIHDHEREAKRGDQSEKCHIIRGIWETGQDVLKIKIAFFDTDIEAELYESYLISSLDGLANIAQGRKNIAQVLLTQDDMQYFGQSIRRIREDGSEYYDAREVSEFFGFTQWNAFHKVIKKIIRIQGLKYDLSWDIVPVYKMVHVGRKYAVKRFVDNYQFSRAMFLQIITAIDSANIVASIGRGYIARMALREHTKQDRKVPDISWIETLNKRLEEPLFLMERDKLVAHAFYASLQRQQLEREEQKRLKQGPQLPLFDSDADQ